MKRIVFVFVVALFFGCSDDNDGEDFEPIPVTQFHMAKGFMTGSENFPAEHTVINSIAEYNAFNDLLEANNPNSYIFVGNGVDFSMHTVIAVVDYIGNSPYRTIDIVSVYEHEDKIVVTTDCLNQGSTAQVVNHPYHVIRIPKKSKPVVFDDLRN